MQSLASAPKLSPMGFDEQSLEKLRLLNDGLRKRGLSEAWGTGRVFLSAGIANKPSAEQIALMQRVKEFNDFENDLLMEHDHGRFTHDGVRYFWKIDYYDSALKCQSTDPTDPSLTCRVLTLVHVWEY